MLNCCQKSSETSSVGPIFECLKIKKKTFLKSLSEIQHSSLQMKIKNIDQLSVSVKLRYEKHFSMSFLSKYLWFYHQENKKHLLYRKRMILKTFLQTSAFSLYKMLTSTVAELFTTMDLMLLDSLLLKSFSWFFYFLSYLILAFQNLWSTSFFPLFFFFF